jgi:hypothetical protein
VIKKPNLGDVVYVTYDVLRRRDCEPFAAEVVSVGRKYFYVRKKDIEYDNEIAFSIDSYTSGYWKEYLQHYTGDKLCYSSKEVYDKVQLKKQMIDEIVNRHELEAMSLLKVNAIHFVLTNTKDFREDWEVSDD